MSEALVDSAAGATDPSFWNTLLATFDWSVAGRLALLLLAFPALAMSARWLQHFLRRHRSEQSALLARKALVYCGSCVLVITILAQLGIRIGPILGAVGLAGVAIGFASQTSLSNIISGLFLLADQPFKVGDLIDVDGSMGFVIEIDLLSIKIRAFDNKVIRIPNEVAIKAKLANITRFPIRRADHNLVFDHDSDVATIRACLSAACEEQPLVLAEPEPVILFKEINELGLVFFLGAWAEGEDFLAMRNALMDDLVARCQAAGLRFARPRRLIEQADAQPTDTAVPS